MSYSAATARAVLLVGILGSTVLETVRLAFRSRAGVYQKARGHRPPLDLESRRFRYLVRDSDDIVPLPEPVIGRSCRKRHPLRKISPAT